MSALVNARRTRMLAALLALSAALWAGVARADATPHPSSGAPPGTLTNPVGEATDPSIVTHDDSYYLIGTELSSNKLGIQKSSTIAGLKSVPRTIVYDGDEHAGQVGCCTIWSPVLQFVDGRWYIYFSTTDPSASTWAIYVLEGNATDPLGPYEFKAELARNSKEEAIVGPSVFETPNGELYLTTTAFGLHIRPLADPYTVSGPNVTIDDGIEQTPAGKPTLPWEGSSLEISRAIVRTDPERIIVPYTSENHAFGERTDGGPCWSWCIGMFVHDGGDVLDPDSWEKWPEPVFHGGLESGYFTVQGLNTFVSPDGTEDWIVYNALDVMANFFNDRDTFVQRFTWNDDNIPDFGAPVPLSEPIRVPSSETGSPPAYAPGERMFADDFGSDAAARWTVVAGSWDTCGTKPTAAYCAAGTGNDVALAGDPTWDDYTVEATVVPSTGGVDGGVDILGRVRDVDNFYQLELITDGLGVKRWVISKRADGNYHTLATGPYEWRDGEEYRLRFVLNNERLTAAISRDGRRYQLLGEVEDNKPAWESGRIGLRSWGAVRGRFDDVTVIKERPTWGFYTGSGWRGVGINSGGPTVRGFLGDDGYFDEHHVGGTPQRTEAAIDTSGVRDPAPQDVYRTQRRGATRFSHAIPSLEPNTPYRVRLHFAEIQYTEPGERTFDVALNDQRVMEDFDVVAAAGGPNEAVTREFTTRSSANGHILLELTRGEAGDGSPILSGVQVQPRHMRRTALSEVPACRPEPRRGKGRDRRAPGSPTVTGYRLNAGNGAVPPYDADRYGYGPTWTAATGAPIARDGVEEAAPERVYQSERWSTRPFSYILPNLEPCERYRVRLHFAEIYYREPGRRSFNVDLNGQRVLENFDKLAAAGGPDRAVVREFVVRADSVGRMVVELTRGGVADGNPAINGLEVLPAF